MSAKQGHAAEPGVMRAVERQMSNWELARTQHFDREPHERPATQHFICISRLVGIDGHEVADLLGERLQWPVFDRQVLDLMAGNDEVRRRLYAAMDEHDLKWWQSAMSPLVVGRFVVDDYFHRLCDAILALARKSACIFLGRGAELILPPESGVRVRLVAGLASRIRDAATARGLTSNEARAWIEREEAERAGFFRRYFKAEPADPARYDLALNLDRMSPEIAAELILAARRAKPDHVLAAVP